MDRNRTLTRILWCALLSVLVIAMLGACSSKTNGGPSQIVQIGSMHESIGQRHHHGRIALSEIARNPHFYGVGALAGLKGEITIFDSTPIVTVVGADGEPLPSRSDTAEATILVGQSVGEWKSVTVKNRVSHGEFDMAIAHAASAAGIDLSHPFAFVIDGNFLDTRVHIINGACPIHARMKRIEIESDNHPYELEQKSIAGRVIGIYAANAVGTLTHPATSTHAHLVYSPSQGTLQLTAHIEQIGIAAGSILRFPAVQ